MRQYSFAKNYKSQTVIREKLSKTLAYEKGAHKMLMKLTPWIERMLDREKDIYSFFGVGSCRQHVPVGTRGYRFFL
jgi:hypothetical protein